MKALKLILIAVAFLAVALLIAGLIAPNEVTVKKSTNIKAPPSAVWANLKYFDKVVVWHPWLKKDPNLLISVVGQDGSAGAVRRWDSDKSEVGSGEETLLTVEENAYIESRIDITSPRPSEGINQFSLVDYGGNTQVIWQFKYEVPYPWNAFMLFQDPQSGLEDYFAEGLTGLKNILERRERSSVNYMVNDHSLRENTYAIIREKVQINYIEKFALENLEKLTTLRSEAGMRKAGFPAGLIYEWNTQEGYVDYAIGIPVVEENVFPDVDYVNIEATSTAKTVFVNDLYNSRQNAHRFLRSKMEKEGLNIQYPVLEIYMKGPLSEFPEDNAATRLVYRYEN